MDGQVIREASTEGAIDIRFRREAGLVVRLDPRRYQERNQLKLSLMDLPLLPEQLRELLPRPSGNSSTAANSPRRAERRPGRARAPAA